MSKELARLLHDHPELRDMVNLQWLIKVWREGLKIVFIVRQ
ncbi:MAG: hypothetical protein V2A63_02400 [Patescibacteria group bacterium]